MKTELEEIFRALELLEKLPNAVMAGLWGRVQKAFDDPLRAKEMIKELEHRRRADDDIPLYNLFTAFMFSEAGEGKDQDKDKDNENAIQFAIKAADGFKWLDKKWHEALAHWMLGVLYVDTGDEQKIPTELQSAVDIFSKLIKEKRDSGRYQESQKIYEFLLKRLEWAISLPYRPQYIPASEEARQAEFKKEHAEELKDTGGYLSLSLPIFSSVTAGKNGPTWATMTADAVNTHIDQIVLGDRRYVIFSVKKNDKQILFNSKRLYGWAEVEGNSMNADKPTPIEEKDMVLYYQADDATGNSLVIASCPDEKGAGFKYMIKRWDAGNNQFISHSKQSGFEPIPRDANHTIIGVVSAVAKPIVQG